MKMYIAIHESVPVGYAIVAAAHASLATYLRFRDDPAVREWLAGSFRKVIVRANDVEFDAVKAVSDNVVLTESALGGREVAIGFRPRADSEWPNLLRHLPLYKGPGESK